MSSANQEMVSESLEFLASVYNYNHWMARTIEPFCGERVVEIGCGNGNILQYFLLKEKVVGVDVDERFVGYCQEKFKDHNNCHFQLGNILDDDFALEGSIDTVICLNVLEHIEKDQQFLKRFYDLLPPGGSLVLLVPAHPSIYGELDKVAGHFRRYVKEELICKVSGSGFHVLRSFYFNSVGYFGWGLNSRFMKKRSIPIKSTLLYDRYIVPLQSYVEGICHPFFGQSIILHAHKESITS